MNIRGWYVDSKIKKIKAPIGDENGNQIENKSKRRKIKKIKAPIGDENHVLPLRGDTTRLYY